MPDDSNKPPKSVPTPSQRAQELEAQQQTGGVSDAEVKKCRELFRYLLTRDEGPMVHITMDTYWHQLLNKQRFGELVANYRIRVYIAYLMLSFTKSDRNKEILRTFVRKIDQAAEAERSASSSAPLEVSV